MIADRTLKEHSSTSIVDFSPPTAVFRAVLKYSDLTKNNFWRGLLKVHLILKMHTPQHHTPWLYHLNSRMVEWAKIVFPSQTRETSAFSLFLKSSDILATNWDSAIFILRDTKQYKYSLSDFAWPKAKISQFRYSLVWVDGPALLAPLLKEEPLS